MHPDQIFQHNRPDIVRRAATCVAAVVGADKVVLPLLKIAGGAVPHFRPTVGTVDHAGKQAALAGFRPAVALLTDFLNLVKLMQEAGYLSPTVSKDRESRRNSELE